MKKTQLNQLNKMLGDENIKGKELLKQFIWRNTVESKYNVGDKVKFSARGNYIYGNKVDNFVGIIESVTYIPRNRVINYKIVAHYSVDTKETHKTLYYCDESEIISKTKLSEINYINKNSKDKETISIPIRF